MAGDTPDVSADAFLTTIFDGCTGVPVVCNAEDSFRSRRWRPGRELKGTVYFCISTVRDVPRADVLQRRTVDLVGTWAIVLDDIGTKVEREKLAKLLAPSWRLETSAGNEQWGYILKHGCTPQRAAALIEALAQAGLTDPGAKRADRIMRVPGSINANKGGFVARLLAWNPERQYGYAELAQGLGVRPTDTPPAAAAPELPPGISDTVFVWMLEQGQVLAGPNPRGWYKVRCPQEHLHSGDVDHGTDYRPGMPGVFKCQHAHCSKLSTNWLKEWIRAQDPGADLSVMSEADLNGIGAKLRGALGVVAAAPGAAGLASAAVPGEQKSGLGGGLVEALRAQAARSMFAGSLAASDAVADEIDATAQLVLDDIVHVASESKFWSRAAGCLLDAKAVDNRWYPVMSAAGLLDRPKRAPMRPHEWLMQHPGMIRASRLVHRLGEPLIVDDCLNIAPPLPAAVEYSGEPTPWLELISFICQGNDEDIDYLLDWCAFVVTAWDEKPGFHLILKGKQGVGKNLVLLPIVEYLKPEHHQLISAALIGGQFNAFLTRRMVSVDELKMTTRGASTAHDIYNNLKAWTTRGASTITVNDKNTKLFEVADRSCWAITTNESVPLPIEDDDRRFFVIEAPRKKMAMAWYARIYDWLNAGGQRQVIGWLQKRWTEMTEAERQRMREHAPMTSAKIVLMEEAAEGIDGAIRLSIAGRLGEPWPDLMRLEDVIEKLKLNVHDFLTEAARKAITSQRTIAALRAAGAQRLFGGAQIGNSSKIRLWCMRGAEAERYERMGQTNALVEEYQRQRTPSGVVSNVIPLKPSPKG